MLTDASLTRWSETLPAPRGALAADAAALERFTADAEALLASLPAKPDRGPYQQELADRLHAGCRALRSRLMRGYAARVYDRLTDGRTVHRRLSELCYAAAEEFPGLVPTREQIAEERQHVQAEKEGREADQAIFFAQLLRRPDTGAHLIEAMLRPTPRALGLLSDFSRTGAADLGTVRIDRIDAIAHLTVRNVHCLNAEDDVLADDLETAVDLALLDPAVKVAVLRGGTMSHPRYQGKRVFSAGINLRDLHNGQISYVDFLLGRELGYIHKILRGLSGPPQAVEKPWVAAVDGFAIGGGTQLTLVFDRVLATSDAYFSLPAAREGIVPGAANFRLGRRAGNDLARQMILGGRKVWAATPDGRRLCDEVVEPQEMDGAVEAAAEGLASPAVVANRHMLNLAEEPPDRFREYMAEFAEQQVHRLYSQDVLSKIERAVR